MAQGWRRTPGNAWEGSVGTQEHRLRLTDHAPSMKTVD